MCTKKGNPNFVEISGRFYHRDVVFPVRGDHSCAEYDPDAEVVEPDYLAQHGMYAMHGLADEPECSLLGSRYPFESEDERDDRIFGDKEDDPVNPNGDPLDILIAAEESAVGFGDEWDAEDYAFLREEPVEALDVDGITFAHASQGRRNTPLSYEEQDHSTYTRKVTYGPRGKKVIKYAFYESHGVHGRKRARPKHVTVRGAHVRADIISSTRRGPRCVGLVATPRKYT